MTLVNELLEFYKRNDEAFVNDIEELDSWEGYTVILDNDRLIDMEELDDFFQGVETLEILRRAFFGYDDEYLVADQKTPFNPNRDYFYLNGYGNLVSTNERDYSTYLDDELVKKIINNAFYLNLSDGAQEIINNYKDQEKE